MNASNFLQYAAFLLAVFALPKPLGTYLMRVFAGEKTFLDPILRPLENRRLELFSGAGVGANRRTLFDEVIVSLNP